MKLDPGCLYSQEHEWVRVEGDQATIGITDFAQSELSDVVYVELPEVGDTFARGDVLGTVESVKAASDVYTPIDVEILSINEQLDDTPALVNSDPFGAAWLVTAHIVDASQLGDLMDAEKYAAYVETVH
jgi:glycine cleavage system H protein